MIKFFWKIYVFGVFHSVLTDTSLIANPSFFDTKYLIIFMPSMFCHLTQCKPYFKVRMKKRHFFCYLINKDFMTRTVSQRSENFTESFVVNPPANQIPYCLISLNSSTWIKTINIMYVCSSLGVVNLILILLLILLLFKSILKMTWL